MATLRKSFTRRSRLISSADFQKVFDEPHRRSLDKYFVVLMRSNGLGLARLGLAISKKRLKTANARNRAKRIVRESFRHHQEQLSGFDVVVINRDGVKEGSNQELFISLERHWHNLVK